MNDQPATDREFILQALAGSIGQLQTMIHTLRGVPTAVDVEELVLLRRAVVTLHGRIYSRELNDAEIIQQVGDMGGRLAAALKLAWKDLKKLAR